MDTSVIISSVERAGIIRDGLPRRDVSDALKVGTEKQRGTAGRPGDRQVGSPGRRRRLPIWDGGTNPEESGCSHLAPLPFPAP